MAAPRVINPPIQPQRHAEGTAESKRGNEEGDGRRQPPSEIRPLEEAKKEVAHAGDKIRRRARPMPKVGYVYAQVEKQKTKRERDRLMDVVRSSRPFIEEVIRYYFSPRQ